jgi:hypothetical protein
MTCCQRLSPPIQKKKNGDDDDKYNITKKLGGFILAASQFAESYEATGVARMKAEFRGPCPIGDQRWRQRQQLWRHEDD